MQRRSQAPIHPSAPDDTGGRSSRRKSRGGSINATDHTAAMTPPRTTTSAPLTRGTTTPNPYAVLADDEVAPELVTTAVYCAPVWPCVKLPMPLLPKPR